MKKPVIQKRTIRKFIIALITAITGIITLCVGDNEIIRIIAGAAMTIIPTVIYCLMEGDIDARSIGTITDAAVDAAKQLGADEKTVEVIEQIGLVGEILSDGYDFADEDME